MAPASASDAGMRDNHTRGLVRRFRAGADPERCEARDCLGLLTIYAFQVLQGRLESIDELRFLCGESRFAERLIVDSLRSAADTLGVQ